MFEMRRVLAALALAVPALASSAQTTQAVVLAPPQNVMSLAATATLEVPKDWLSVVLSTTKEGGDASQVQAQLKAALDAALADARKLAKPGQVEVRTGSFSMFPRYTPRTSTISGWQGQAELVVEGRDVAAISQFAGRVQTLAIARVGFSLSREAREKVEGDVAASAIARFRAQAEAYAKQFGFAGYALREVQVNTQGDEPRPVPMLRAQNMAAGAAEAALPVEAGRAAVTATVTGSVQMTVR